MDRTVIPKLKLTVFSAVTFVAFFAALEGISCVLFVAPGARDYVERRIIEQGLTKWKSKGEYRVFLYGESTMQGDALSPESTIEKWLALYLEAALGPETASRVRIYNLARLGANSHFIRDSFFDTLAYRPDLAVFYTVHNDFVQLDNRHSNFDPRPLRWGDRGFAERGFRAFVKRSAFCSELARLNIRLKVERHKRRDAAAGPSAPPKIENWEKFYNTEYDSIERDSPVFRTISRNWKNNVRRIARRAQGAGVAVVFFEGVGDYKDYQPNESIHRPPLAAAALGIWDGGLRSAEEARRAGDWPAAALLYERCRAASPEHALVCHRLGECYERLGRYAEAATLYRGANDKDRVPLRAPSLANRFYDRLAAIRLRGVHVIRTQALFEAHAPNGIPDGGLLLDTMHPSVKGQALMARELAEVLRREKLFAADQTWKPWPAGTEAAFEKKLGIGEAFWMRVFLLKAHYVGRFYDKAIEYARKALAIDPLSVEASRHLAWAYWRKGEKEKASEIYHALSMTHPDLVEGIVRQHEDLGKFIAFDRTRTGMRMRRLPIHPD